MSNSSTDNLTNLSNSTTGNKTDLDNSTIDNSTDDSTIKIVHWRCETLWQCFFSTYDFTFKVKIFKIFRVFFLNYTYFF